MNSRGNDNEEAMQRLWEIGLRLLPTLNITTFVVYIEPSSDIKLARGVPDAHLMIADLQRLPRYQPRAKF